jgi:hypothetical protein
VGGGRGRYPRARAPDAAGGCPVRGPGRRDHWHRAVPRARDRSREVPARRPAVVLRHTGQLPRSYQPVRAPAPPDRSLDAHRRAGVQRRAPRIPALCAGRRAGRAQPRRVRHLARGARPREPPRAPDHRHVHPRPARAGAPERPDAWARETGGGARPRHHPGPRRTRRRAGHGHGVSRTDCSRARNSGLENGGRRPRGAAAPARRRPHTP